MVEVPRWGTVIVSALLMISPVLRNPRQTGRSVVGLAIMASAPITGQAPGARLRRRAVPVRHDDAENSGRFAHSTEHRLPRSTRQCQSGGGVAAVDREDRPRDVARRW